MDPHRLAQLRSLAYHREVARRLRADPSLREDARAVLRGWPSVAPASRPHLAAWERLLDGPLEELLRILGEDSEHAATMRSCTPFAGLIDPRERWRIWREVAEGTP